MKKTAKIIISVFVASLMIFTVACTKKDASTSSDASKGSSTTEESTSTNSNSNGDTTTSENLDEILSKVKTSDNYYFEYVIEAQNQTTSTYNMWVKGKKMRMDISSGSDQGGSMYINNETGECYMYTKEQNTAIKVTTKPDNTDTNPFSYINQIDKSTLQGYKKKSTENIDGNKCLVYAYEYDKYKHVMYISEEYDVVLKYEYYEDNKLVSSVYFKNFKVGSVTDEMVTVPKDAKIMDFGSQ